MFISNFPTKTRVQRWLVALQDFVEYPQSHPGYQLRKAALQETVQYVGRHMRQAEAVPSGREVLDVTLETAPQTGHYLEFGVFRGGTIRYIAGKIRPRVVEGFDSFHGLPTSWSGDAFHFDRDGKPPRVPANVRLHKGLFHDTLPAWMRGNPGPVGFLHVDSDLYESASCVLSCLAERITAGTVIVFDEYFNYPGWQEHEFRAFQEFVEARHIRYRYLAYARMQVSVKILEIGAEKGGPT